MEENFCMEWNMEEIFLVWNGRWNGKKLSVWNMEKSSSIPFHSITCPDVRNENQS